MTARLSKAAVTGWETLDGFAVAHGLDDPRELPLQRFTALVWYLMTRNLDEQGVTRLRARLWVPPKGSVIPSNSPWSAENEMKNLRALEMRLGGKGQNQAPASTVASGGPQLSMKQRWDARVIPTRPRAAQRLSRGGDEGGSL